MNCAKCDEHTVKYGIRVASDGKKYQRRQCQSCGHVFNGEEVA